MRERRAFARIAVDLPASMYTYQLDVYHSGSITDLSIGGCFLPIEGETPDRGACSLTLTAGTGLDIRSTIIEGRIVRTTPAGVGIKFENMSPTSRSLIEQVLAQ